MAEPYDPLDYANLARSVVGALLRADRMPLPPERFAGSGVYAIYYTGPLEYTDRYSLGEVPIYVGKAVPAGARKGSRSANPATETSLQRRLSDHAKSIRQAENLIVTEAHCRYLVVESVWITLAEQSLLSYFRPLWNTVLDGFGNHNPGRESSEQRASQMGHHASGTVVGKSAPCQREPSRHYCRGANN